ncbi:MAG: hypothetical protein WBZ42_08815 [Halobacteriota archaeon]
MVDKTWVDQWLNVLSAHITKKSRWALFEPSQEFYEKLETGEDEDLEIAGAEIGRHVELGSLPSMTYQWGITMDPNVGGQIWQKGGTLQNSHIEIPLFYVGKPFAIGAIVAHELTHHFLHNERLVLPDKVENEQFTDLASIALGLGKLVLNGTVSDHFQTAREYFILGYLSSELKAYAYRQVNEQRGISTSEAHEQLNTEAFRIVEKTI